MFDLHNTLSNDNIFILTTLFLQGIIKSITNNIDGIDKAYNGEEACK